MWYTPSEFKDLGGKGKSKNWKKSIYHESSSVPLGVYLASVGVATGKFSSSSPRQLSPARQMEHNNFLVDPVLAFIKVYRLKGDLVGLKQSVCSRFDSSSLGSAHRRMWDFCGSDLDLLGFSYHSRRGSDKRQVTDVLLADIVAAFDKLDSVEKIPAIYCEANELIKLPTLKLDPVSEKLDKNTCTIQSLVDSMKELPSKVSANAAVTVERCCSQLNDLVSTVKQELQQLSGSVSSFTSRLNVPHHAADERSSTAGQAHSVASRVSLDSRKVTKRDRSNHVILFGLPESSLLDTKAAVDELSMFLIGKTINIGVNLS